MNNENELNSDVLVASNTYVIISLALRAFVYTVHE